MEADEPFSSGRVLLLAAHPDDEVIAAGAQMPRLRERLTIVHATNGSPENEGDALSAGFSSGEAYAAARRAEMLKAVGLAGIAPPQSLQLGFTDQRASFHLADLVLAVSELIGTRQPDVILTHPYEGGHPDHDSCAFAARAAVTLIAGELAPRVWEFPSYHLGPQGDMEAGRFLPNAPEHRYRLTGEQQQLKQRMFDCYPSQAQVLKWFSCESEAFRPAPGYDFAQPPHPGRLFYEQFDWGVTGPRWRDLAGEALQTLGLELHATHSS